MKLAPVLCLILLGLGARPAAGSPYPEPRILLHRGATIGKNACDTTPSDCSFVNTRGDLYPAPRSFVYILMERGGIPNVKSINVGVMYQSFVPIARRDGIGVDMFSWTLCADSDNSYLHWNTNVVDPGSSNTFTWTFCRTDRKLVAGYFYVSAYSDDVLKLQNGSIKDCCNDNHPLGNAAMGSVAFSAGAATPGCNPCLENCPGSPTVYVEPDCDGLTPPALLLHVSSQLALNPCLNGPADPALVVTAGDLSTATGPFQYVYLLAAPGQAMSLRNLQCAISYETGSAGDALNGHGVDVFNWTLCAVTELATPGWPEPGSGITIGWNGSPNCNTANVSVAGYFYVGAYTTDKLQILPPAGLGTAQMWNCFNSYFPVSAENLGVAVFSTGAVLDGCNPVLEACPGLTSSVPPVARPPANFTVTPNPFQDHMMMAFEVESMAPCRLDVFDVQGRAVAKLHDGLMSAGLHSIPWDGWRSGGGVAPAGTYYIRLEIDGRERGRKVVRLP